MLSVPVQKDIGEYREKVVAGLSWKMLACIAVGVLCAAIEAIVGYKLLGLSVSDLSIPVMLTVGATFAFGYINPLGLPFEKAIPLLLRQYFGKTIVVYQSSVATRQKETREKERKERLNSKDKHVRTAEKEYKKLKSGRGAKTAEWRIPRYYAVSTLTTYTPDDSQRAKSSS